MKKKLVLAGVLVVAVAAAGFMSLSAVFSETKVSVEDLPAAVRTTIEKHADAGGIIEIERDLENGKTVYDAEVILDGKKTEIEVSGTGEFLGSEDGDDDEAGAGDNEGKEDDDEVDEAESSVDMGNTPQVVKDTLARVLPGVEITGLVQENEDGAIVYEAAYKADGAAYEIKLTEDGFVLETETPIASGKLPPAVVAAIAQKYPGAGIEKADIIQMMVYEVGVEAGNKEIDVSVLANGRIIAEEND